MKRIYMFMALLCLAGTAIASTDSEPQFLWPVKGAKPGSNILSTPQSYIGKEQNLNSLLIEAPEGTVVVSPVTGVVKSVYVQYLLSLTSASSWICETSFDELITLLRAEPDKKYDMKYVGGSISIRSADGRTVTISGLSGEQVFKTGQKITRGEPIGRVAYSYKPVRRPSIMINVGKGGLDADPMTPFGLKTSFQPFKKIEPITSFTPAKVKEDFLTYIDIIRECYPGLHEVISEEELEQYVRNTVGRIDKSSSDWSYIQLEQLMTQTLALVHDCHISPHGPQWRSRLTIYKGPAVEVGWINDTLVCVNAVTEHKHLIGRPVRSVNGMSADSMKSRQQAKIIGYDAKVESTIKTKLALENHSLFFDHKNTAFSDMQIEMADSAGVLDLKTVPPRTAKAYYLRQYNGINGHKGGYSTRMINDKTAYLGISSFDLNQVALEEVGRFIDSVERAKVPHLIVDVRNNGGGDINVLTKIYSYLAGEPLLLNGYLKVNRQGGYRTFARSLNRIAEDSLFAAFLPEAGKDGYYMRTTEWNSLQADPQINYKGKVYVLANENSWSAATLLPALVVRGHRGLVIGRETPTAYHFMNAQKSVDIRLPNSTLAYTIPLVYCRFDTEVNERVPYGRGVLPDYEVPLSINELAFAGGDAILNRALQLIAEGKYLSGKNPFAGADKKKTGK